MWYTVPYFAMTFFSKVSATVEASSVEMDTISSHFEKYTMDTIRYVFPETVMWNGPKMSIAIFSQEFPELYYLNFPYVLLCDFYWRHINHIFLSIFQHQPGSWSNNTYLFFSQAFCLHQNALVRLEVSSDTLFRKFFPIFEWIMHTEYIRRPTKTNNFLQVVQIWWSLATDMTISHLSNLGQVSGLLWGFLLSVEYWCRLSISPSQSALTVSSLSSWHWQNSQLFPTHSLLNNLSAFPWFLPFRCLFSNSLFDFELVRFKIKQSLKCSEISCDTKCSGTVIAPNYASRLTL